MKWCKIGQRAALLAGTPLASVLQAASLVWSSAADFEDSLTLLRLDALTHTVYTVEVASAIPASA